jgi:regulator of G-protein signaling
MVTPSCHTFDEAQVQIYTLMQRDSYPRFLNSPMFKRLLSNQQQQQQQQQNPG